MPRLSAPRLTLALPVALALTLGTSPSALAHARPASMEPAANSVVSSPSQLSVFFTEGLEPKFSSLELFDDKGTVRSSAKSAVDPANSKHMTLALPKLPSGLYRVHWVTAATDGHHMDGDYKFTVK